MKMTESLSTMKEDLTVVIVDPHTMTRYGLRSLLSVEFPFIKVVGDTGCYNEAESIILSTHPGLVFIDNSFGPGNGLELISATRQVLPSLKVIVYSTQNFRACLTKSLAAGINGFILKSDPIEEIKTAIAAASNNATYFSKEVLKTLNKLDVSTGYRSPLVHLSEGEIQVLTHVAMGLRNQQIAQVLKCSVRTVETYREHLMGKVNIRSVAGLTLLAVREGLITVD